MAKEGPPDLLQLPRHAIAREVPAYPPRAFRESVPSAISPKVFEPTDFEELELLAKNLQQSKDAEELLQKQKQLEELEQHLARQGMEAQGKLDECLAQKVQLEEQLEPAARDGPQSGSEAEGNGGAACEPPAPGPHPPKATTPLSNQSKLLPEGSDVVPFWVSYRGFP